MDSLGSVVYAARLADGTIKIGCTERFGSRLSWLKSYVGQDVELLAFMLGTVDDERSIHASLTEHRAAITPMSREYYHPTPDVMAVVNGMRTALNLPHIAP